MALDYYYDVNETIYATDSGVSSLVAGSTTQRDLGLQDLTDLSGQSTIFVNKVRFNVIGTLVKGTGLGQDYAYGHMLCGVIPSDLVNTDFDLFSSYQDYKAWPLKMGKHFYFQKENDIMNNGFRMSFTYTPRKALLLNREQSIVLCVTNELGMNCQFHASINLQAKRGD